MNYKTNLLTRATLLTLTFLLGSIMAFAQTAPQSVSGTYEGIVKTPDAREIKISLELKSEGEKLSGRVTHGDKTAEITEGKMENGTLTLNFGNNRTFLAKVDGDKLVGEAIDGTAKIPLELKKVPPATAAAPAAAPSASAPAEVNLNGSWEAVADANGQTVPFLLKLKVDGETVTGSSSSQLGEATIKSGSWKGGKLAFDLEGASGVISMTAVVIDGKLSGDFDFAGQAQGKWVAVKKN